MISLKFFPKNQNKRKLQTAVLEVQMEIFIGIFILKIYLTIHSLF